jgi:hypothetical protein
MNYDLGYVDLEERTLQPLDNPFGPKCYLCSRYALLPMCSGRTKKYLAEEEGFDSAQYEGSTRWYALVRYSRN